MLKYDKSSGSFVSKAVDIALVKSSIKEISAAKKQLEGAARRMGALGERGLVQSSIDQLDRALSSLQEQTLDSTGRYR